MTAKKKPEDLKKLGRPTDYTEELAQKILDAIGTTSYSVRRICRDNPEFPDERTLFRWLITYPSFCQQYTRAKEYQVEVELDRMKDIAEDSSEDEEFDERGRRRINREFVERSRLKIDVIKWSACKRLPRKYGDRVHTEVTGQDGAPIEYRDLTDDEKKAKILGILDKAKKRATE